MYRRSFRRPVRRFSRGGFRRAGSRLTTVRRPVRWERGNFYFEFIHSHIAGEDEITLNTVVPIASINALINSTLPDEEPWGRQLTEMTRALIVGGVKFTCYQNLIGFPQISSMNNPDTAQNFAESSAFTCDTKVLLVSDQMFMDPATGIATPQSVNANFWTNTTPTARVPAIEDLQAQYPKRIHWQNYKALNGGWRYGVGINYASENTYYQPFQNQQSEVVSTHSTSNLRLRLRLQDDDSLNFFLSSHLNRSETAASFGCDVLFKFTGTIWYRYVI